MSIIEPMVSKIKDNHELHGFRDRLINACNDAGINPRTRQSQVAEWFGMSPNAALKWFHGTGWPAIETAVGLANRLGVCVDWLLTGRGPKRPGDPISDERYLASIVNTIDALHRNGCGDWPVDAKIQFANLIYEIYHDLSDAPSDQKITALIKRFVDK